MKKELLEVIKKEIKKIMREGEILDVEIEKIEEDEEKFEFCGYDEEEREINIPKSRLFKPVLVASLGLSLLTGVSIVVNTNMIEPNSYVVEAASKKNKDKKKPIIKLRDGKIKEVEQGKKVKNLGATAKDNKDGNITKKIKVTVKRKKKNYKTIANKIEKNKSVEFKDLGEYSLTYTVSDKAGNKTTKKRKIKVVKPKNKKPIISVTTTETPTTKEITTETPTTENVTTEIYTTDPKYRVDYSEFNMIKITVNGKTYNTTKDNNFYKITDANLISDKVFIDIENDYDTLVFDADTGLTNNSSYLNFLGKITAYDENGNDISDNIVIYELPLIADGFIINSMDYILYIYVEDIYGNTLKKPLDISLRSSKEDIPFDELKDLILVNNSPVVYGRKRVNENNLSSSIEGKALKFLDK